MLFNFSFSKYQSTFVSQFMLVSLCSLLKFRIKREEARITAWENLQKAKAEAAMRKLEVGL